MQSGWNSRSGSPNTLFSCGQYEWKGLQETMWPVEDGRGNRMQWACFELLGGSFELLGGALFYGEEDC